MTTSAQSEAAQILRRLLDLFDSAGRFARTPQSPDLYKSPDSCTLGDMRTRRRDYSTLPLVAYLRVSTAGQAASGLGLDAQRQAITAEATAQGFVIAGWYEDAGRSGGTMRGRSGLADALAEIDTGRAGGLVVHKVDRLGRSSVDILGLVERAQSEGWRLVALDVGLDTTTPAGEIVAAALAMAARFEWRRTSERQLAKHEQLRRQGRPRGRATVDPATVARIDEYRAHGYSYSRIAALLTAENVPTARGGGWYASTVRSALLTRRREIAAQAADLNP